MARPSQRHAGAEEGLISDENITDILAKFRSPDSPDFPVRFRPRVTGQMTRAVVTEYQIPRIGATTRAVLVDPNTGYVWYTDWRSYIIGRVDPGEGPRSRSSRFPRASRNDLPGFSTCGGTRRDTFWRDRSGPEPVCGSTSRTSGSSTSGRLRSNGPAPAISTSAGRMARWSTASEMGSRGGFPG